LLRLVAPISRVEVVHLAPLKVQKNGIWIKARMESARDAPSLRSKAKPRKTSRSYGGNFRRVTERFAVIIRTLEFGFTKKNF